RIGPIVGDGARKERLRRRAYERPTYHAKARRYAELHAGSAFSFLEGASLPEDLVDRAVALELPAVALLDTNGAYGAPRFYKAAKTAGIRALVGAEITLTTPATVKTNTTGSSSRGPRGLVPPPPDVPYPPPPRVTLLVESRRGYKNLCRLVTAGAAGKA